MLKLEQYDTKDEGVKLRFTSDDKNAENFILGEAISQEAPHLLMQFENTEVNDDDLLIFDIGREDWSSVLEMWEYIEGESIPIVGLTYEQVETMARERNA